MEINHVCSLGKLCHSAKLLIRNKVKLYSYPFDWIFSNPDIILHCIENNFKIFLDKSYYKSFANEQCQHTYYFGNSTEFIMFNHYNPLIHQKDYEYYKRCVDRFVNLIKRKETKLFTIMFTNISQDDQSSIKNEMRNFNSKFKNLCENYILLVILQSINTSKNEHDIIEENNIIFLDVKTMSKSSGVEFELNNDNIYLDNIINDIFIFNLSVNEQNDKSNKEGYMFTFQKPMRKRGRFSLF